MNVLPVTMKMQIASKAQLMDEVIAATMARWLDKRALADLAKLQHFIALRLALESKADNVAQ